jgi:valyl-tRNA synthetase
MIPILTLDAKINDNAPARYQGMDRFRSAPAGRRRPRSRGLLDKVDAHTLKVPRGDRTGVVIEPMLTDQWFVAMSKAGCRRQQHRRQGAGLRRLGRDQVLPRELGQHL